MNDDAATLPEFGTGLRARLERIEHAHARPPALPIIDLLTLVEDEAPEQLTPELVLVGRDLEVRSVHGAAAA
ncbi:MAG TPA: hypothetical protein VG479_10015 [Gaiellaceae bacterium]|jgi:hypothetical protein|nr:hypothetical protein [Gaiellaceae bacterium]